MSDCSSIKFCLRIRSTDGNIRDCLLLICAFIISDVTQSVVLQFVKNNIFGFSVVKLSKSRSLKLNISRTAWPILMILVSFGRILNGLSNEINLFWHCSSPLRKKTYEKHEVITEQELWHTQPRTWHSPQEVTAQYLQILISYDQREK